MAKRNINVIPIDAKTLGGEDISSLKKELNNSFDVFLASNRWNRIAVCGRTGGYIGFSLAKDFGGYIPFALKVDFQLPFEGQAIEVKPNVKVFNTTTRDLSLMGSFKIRIVSDQSTKETFIDIYMEESSSSRYCGFSFYILANITLNSEFVFVNEVLPENEILISEWDCKDYVNTETQNLQIMQLTDNQAQMGGGITAFRIGDYAVTVRQKGGQRNGQEKYKRDLFFSCNDAKAENNDSRVSFRRTISKQLSHTWFVPMLFFRRPARANRVARRNNRSVQKGKLYIPKNNEHLWGDSNQICLLGREFLGLESIGVASRKEVVV